MRVRQYVWLDEPYGEIGPLRIAKRYYNLSFMWRWLARISFGLLFGTFATIVLTLVTILGMVIWSQFWYGPY